MGAELLSSKVVITERAPSVRGIPVVSTAVLGMVGVAERGPIDEATLVTSFAEYERIFGGYLADYELAQAVAAFFAEGGSQIYVVRTVHHNTAGDPTTATATRHSNNLTTPGADAPAEATGGAAPFNLEPGQTLVVSVSGGGDATATFTAQHGYVEGGAGPFALADGQTLTFAFQGGDTQTVTFAAADVVAIGAVTLAEAITIINEQIIGGRAIDSAGVLRIQSDRRGTSSAISAPAGTAAAAFGFAAPVAGAGNVANIDAVTHSEVETIVEAAVAGIAVIQDGDGNTVLQTAAVGAAATVQVKNTSTATALGFDNAVHAGEDDASANAVLVESKYPGEPACDVKVADATSGEAARFNLQVLVEGVVIETWPNLSMDSADARYIETVINNASRGSNRIRVTDQDLAGTPRPENQTVTLAGGVTGLVGLVDNDFLGGTSANGKTALRALDAVLDLSLVAIPGKASNAIHNGLITYCETTRDGLVFAVLDPPAAQSTTQIITYVETTAALLEASDYAAMYWPRVKVLNPDKSVFGNADTITIAPSGVVCGVYARTDAARPGGVYDSPAGITRGVCRSVLGFESDEVLDEAKRDLLYPKRINPIRTEPGFPRYIDGGRTLKSTGNFPNVAERRGVILIKRSLLSGLQFARHENNDESLRARVRRTVGTFLLQQMNRGAFRSRDPASAFFVTCDDSNNPASAIFAGELHCDVGVATQKPAEFIQISITQDTRALDAELAAAGL